MLVSGKSRNVVTAKLRNFEQLEASLEEERIAKEKVNDDDIIVDEEETKKDNNPASSKDKTLPAVCEFQNLAPFCLGKKPLMIIPILPKEKKDPGSKDEEAAAAEAQSSSVEMPCAAAPSENIKIVFASIYISQIVEVVNDNLVKKGSRGGAPPGADPNPKHEALWPMTKFHASNWPIAIRMLDMVNRHGSPAKLQMVDVLRWENLS